jgi:hypothetical protein
MHIRVTLLARGLAGADVRRVAPDRPGVAAGPGSHALGVAREG